MYGITEAILTELRKIRNVFERSKPFMPKCFVKTYCCARSCCSARESEFCADPPPRWVSEMSEQIKNLAPSLRARKARSPSS